MNADLKEALAFGLSIAGGGLFLAYLSVLFASEPVAPLVVVWLMLAAGLALMTVAVKIYRSISSYKR